MHKFPLFLLLFLVGCASTPEEPQKYYFSSYGNEEDISGVWKFQDNENDFGERWQTAYVKGKKNNSFFSEPLIYVQKDIANSYFTIVIDHDLYTCDYYYEHNIEMIFTQGEKRTNADAERSYYVYEGNRRYKNSRELSYDSTGKKFVINANHEDEFAHLLNKYNKLTIRFKPCEISEMQYLTYDISGTHFIKTRFDPGINL